MNALEFIDAINELDSDELIFEYISATNYRLISHMPFRLPTIDKRTGVWLRNVLFTNVMPTMGISYHGTFEDTIITTRVLTMKLFSVKLRWYI